MKNLILHNTQDEDIRTATNDLVNALHIRGVNVKSNKPGFVKFEPSSLMFSDIKFLTENLDYSYAKFANTTFPTTKLSDNGKDKEFYLNTLSKISDTKLTIIINTSAGSISLKRA